tara:strand:- start:5496 stop:6596 length:1101 start_codon:yes stop_codon:yes gene_type:complete
MKPKNKSVAIIGCGINGIGTALAFSEKGYQVKIFEKGRAFAETSSKSSKLLHGGLRYLENGHFGLVQEALKERAAWVQQVPNFTNIERFYLPIYQGKSRNRFILYAGVKLYELLAGKHSLGQSKFHSVKDTLQNNSNLKHKGLIGSVSYVDVQMDDHKIALWLLEKARSKGVEIREGVEVTSFDVKGNVAVNGKEHHSFDYVINAAGPWAKKLLTANRIESNFDMSLVKGSHLIVSRQTENPLVLQNNEDGRIIFMLPSAKGSIIGTTEIPQKTSDNIICSDEETNYLLDIVNSYINEPINHEEIMDTYSGVRPLVFDNNKSSVSKISRDSATEQIGSLINIYGGKWTSGLSLGQKVVSSLQKKQV